MTGANKVLAVLCLALLPLVLFNSTRSSTPSARTALESRPADAGKKTPLPDLIPKPGVNLDPGLSPLGVNEQGFEEFRASDGSVLIHVPAGKCIVSVRTSTDRNLPILRQKMNVEGYLIGKYEVTNEQFERFVKETGFRQNMGAWANYSKKGGARAPVVYVSWRAASAYCAWAGHRLPTLVEWQKAARGTDGRSYPWGNQWDANRCNNFDLSRADYGKQRADFSSGRGPVPAGLIKEGASPCGALDMAGNVAEWCSDSDGPGDPHNDKHGFEGWEWRVLMGGSWDDFRECIVNNPPRFVRSPEYGGTYSWGFRVARSR